MLKNSLVMKQRNSAHSFRRRNSPHRPPFFLITVTETFLDAESREEQDGRNNFLMGATAA